MKYENCTIGTNVKVKDGLSCVIYNSSLNFVGMSGIITYIDNDLGIGVAFSGYSTVEWFSHNDLKLSKGGSK